MLHCVEKLNHKAYVYAGVTKVIAKENQEFGKEIVDWALEIMRVFMKDGLDYEAESQFLFILCLRDCRVISEDAMD